MLALYLPQNKSPEEVARFRASLKEHDAKFAEIEKRGYVTAIPEIFLRDIFAPKTRKPTAEEDALLAQHYDDLMTVFDEIRLSGRLRGWYLRRKYRLVNHFIF